MAPRLSNVMRSDGFVLRHAPAAQQHAPTGTSTRLNSVMCRFGFVPLALSGCFQLRVESRLKLVTIQYRSDTCGTGQHKAAVTYRAPQWQQHAQADTAPQACPAVCLYQHHHSGSGSSASRPVCLPRRKEWRGGQPPAQAQRCSAGSGPSAGAAAAARRACQSRCRPLHQCPPLACWSRHIRSRLPGVQAGGARDGGLCKRRRASAAAATAGRGQASRQRAGSEQAGSLCSVAWLCPPARSHKTSLFTRMIASSLPLAAQQEQREGGKARALALAAGRWHLAAGREQTDGSTTSTRPGGKLGARQLHPRCMHLQMQLAAPRPSPLVPSCWPSKLTSAPVALPRHHPLHPIQAAKAGLPGAAGTRWWGRVCTCAARAPRHRSHHRSAAAQHAPPCILPQCGAGPPPTSHHATHLAVSSPGTSNPMMLLRTSASPRNAASNSSLISWLYMLAGLPTPSLSVQEEASRRSACTHSRWGRWSRQGEQMLQGTCARRR